PDNDYGWGRIDAYKAVSMVAHTGVLAGTVKDAETGAPLSATVTILEIGASANTDAATGWYSLTAPAGDYTAEAEALSYPPQTATVTIIEGRTVIQDFALSLVDPEIEVSTTSISMTLISGEKASSEFTISNVGPIGSGLRFNIQEGLLAQNFPWISEKPTSSTVDGGSSQKVEALFDTTGLFRGIYEVDLLISSNDRDNPLVTVNVELTVLEPDIAVAPDKFDVKVEYNTTHEKTMTIMNNGDGMLRFNIVDESVSTPKAVASTHATDSLSPDKYPKMYPNRAPLGPNHAPIPPLESPMASVIPTLDGTYSPGEWDDSAIVSVTPIIDPEGAEVGKLYVKNSAANLYVLIDQHTQSGTSVDITGDMWFDLDNNGSNDGGLYTEVYFGYVYSYFDYPARVEVGESATPSNPSPHWIFEYEIPLSGIGMSVGSLFGIHFILYNYFDYVQAGEWYNYSGDFDYYYPDRWADIRLSDWLTESPTAGTLNPGESISITLTFDANGLRNGDYLANVLVRNNDPDMPTAIVPARMEVYNAPQAIISVTPESFDKTIDGWTAITDTMTISNLGSIPLEFSIRDKTGWLSETPTWGQVEPGNSIAVTVNFDSNGLEDGDYYDSIIINSNDFDRPEVVVPAHIKVINAPKPDIDVSPLSFDETLPKGYKITRTMTIKNTADVAPLKFNITDALPMKMTGNLPKIENNQPFSVVDGNYPKTEAREKIDGPPVIAGSGGPDAFGYRWIDSDEPGGPVFDWLDIRDIGTRIEPLGDDWNVGPFDIGFDFPFYGNKFDKFQFCTNGFISFTSYSAQFWPTPLPSWDAPENLVAPFLTDFEFFSGGEAYYWSNGVDTLVVEYYNVPHLAFGGSYTFEVILRSNGSITYQYKQIEGPTDWATVGIQNADRTIGLQVAYNTPYIHDNLAIMIASEVLWLDEEPSSGVLLPGESVDIAVTFNTTELSIGDYVAEIIISSNDPDENPWVAPVSLKVREVLLSLAPSQKEVAKGDVFTVEMQLDTQGIKINGASAYLSFEDTFLQAVGAPSGKGGPFTPGTFIGGTVLDNDSHGDPGNNLPGLQMDYSEGITDKTISGKGTLASFRLNATKLPADSGATVPINFDFDPQNQRDTVVSLPEGFVIKPAISKPAATIIINKNAALTTWGISGKALLQGRQKHNANITFELRMSGGKEPILVRQAVTNTDGAFTIDKIPGGTYDLTAKEFHYLRAISKPITIPPSATNVTFDSKLPGSPQNALRAGECNDDNAVNLNDLSILALFFGKSATPPKEIPKPEEPPTPWHADIDGNGIVDMSDFTLLASNFGQQGVPGGLLAAPAEQLLAGINSNATFRMQPSTGHRSVDGTYGVPLGEAFELQIIAESATDLRGYSLELEYDSAAIQLINDTNGVASEGVFLRRTKSENSTLFFSQIRNEEAASQMQNITIASSTTGSYSSVSGNGAVASLRFRVLKKQPGAISMSNLLVVDSRGNLNRLSDSTALIKAIPRKSRLAQNYPNPFNPDTWIPFELAEEAPVLIRIYNVNGQLVKTLALGLKAPGFYVDKQQAAYWNGRNEISEKVASGVYFYVMEAGKFRTARKMVILK
ncbi:T9SS type A sorting domain-containing protein, partial [Candidatus Poribacteria bacterium]|nr:T9SS type A sorting domain-containing protein [Candidatus Poribacteria bacterium]